MKTGFVAQQIMNDILPKKKNPKILQRKVLYLRHDVRDGGGAHDDAELMLEEDPGVNPRLDAQKKRTFYNQSRLVTLLHWLPLVAHKRIAQTS